MTNFKRRATAISVLFSCVLFLRAPSAAAKDSPQNERLLAAVEAFEGLSETALTGDAKKIDAAYKAAEKQRASTRTLIPAANTGLYDRLFSSLEAAHSKRDNIAVSLQASELYKLIVSSLDPSGLTIPQEVGLLDYSGMRTNALLKTTPLDWTALAATAQEANSWWGKVSGRVTDKNLQSEMAKAQKGLTDAARAHDAALSRSSAGTILDLVDELERYFTKIGKK